MEGWCEGGCFLGITKSIDMKIKKYLVGIFRITLLLLIADTSASANNSPPIPFDIVAVFGIQEPEVDGKGNLITYLESVPNVTILKPGKEYLVPGKNKAGADKSYRVLVGETEAELKTGLSTQDCAVVFEGHSNFGIGPSFAPATNITRLSSFMNLGSARAPIHWDLAGNFYANLTIEDSEVANDVNNYEVPNLDLAGNLKLRFVNIDGVGNNQTFHLTGTATGRKHYRVTEDSNRVIVNAGNADAPPLLKYGSFYYNACNSGRHFLETFNRGDFFYTIDNCESAHTSRVFVQKTIEGKTSAQILEALNLEENVHKKHPK